MSLRAVSDGVRWFQIAKHEQQLTELNEANEEATARAAGYLHQVSPQLAAASDQLFGRWLDSMRH